MRVLALETSTEYCSVALWLDGAVVELCELVGQKHSELLMAMLEDVLKQAGVKLAQLDGIAFGMGPGSFTGVRIACGAAQGLAFGAGSGFAVHGAVLAERYAGQLQGVDDAAVPQAVAIAALGAAQFAQGAGMDAAEALPLYLRDKVALKTHEREAPRSS